MNTRVLFFPELNQNAKPLSQIIPVYESDMLKQLGKKALVEIRTERKFIVIKSPEEIIVAIGPLWQNDNYYHRELHATCLNHAGLSEAHNTSGGGQFTLIERHSPNSLPDYKSGLFNGRSGTYGPFDPIILSKDVMKAIAQALKLSVSFAWEGGADPLTVLRRTTQKPPQAEEAFLFMGIFIGTRFRPIQPR